MKNKKIVIIGSGPCGLGAAWRLSELGYKNYVVYEKNSYPGGLASSFIDNKGFTWDIGGHVEFSHYEYFDSVLTKVVRKEEWLYHNREAWIWIKNRFIPYPFQKNISHLSFVDQFYCIITLILAQFGRKQNHNFYDFIYSHFGRGISKMFLDPYNYKVWATDLKTMSYNWIGERVAKLKLKDILLDYLNHKQNLLWGPNSKFKYPLKGGTGAIWQGVYKNINSNKFIFNKLVNEIDMNKKILILEDNQTIHYDILINTSPLDIFISKSNIAGRELIKRLRHTKTNVFGFGMTGSPPKSLSNKCWIYFPDRKIPFYRVTILSNYSPFMTPNNKNYWSIMLEASTSQESGKKTELKDVIQGAINSRLIDSHKSIVSIWRHFEEYGYPVPTLSRDETLGILKDLEKYEVYSRGRFGAWKYEVSNQDHVFMQGVEVIDRILLQKPETTLHL